MLSTGYKGQPTEHPYVKIIMSNEREYFAALDKLGLTPAARERMNVRPPVGAGKFGGALGA